jgi:ADP-ribose pyrophosphatase YjhB (NUDIX family)
MNPIVAVGSIIEDPQGRVLLIRRARDPGKGKLGIPGGFVDPGETAEEGAAREAKEEVNLVLESPRYIASFPNRYAYRGVVYPVLDIFFAARVASFEPLRALEEVESCCLLRPDEIDLDEIAFPSIRKALETHIRQSR